MHRAMKNRLLLAIFASLFLFGCGEHYDPNLAQNPPKSEIDAARARRDEAVAIFKRADGDWNKLTPEDKKRIIEFSNNDEMLAQKGWPALGSMSN